MTLPPSFHEEVGGCASNGDGDDDGGDGGDNNEIDAGTSSSPNSAEDVEYEAKRGGEGRRRRQAENQRRQLPANGGCGGGGSSSSSGSSSSANGNGDGDGRHALEGDDGQSQGVAGEGAVEEAVRGVGGGGRAGGTRYHTCGGNSDSRSALRSGAVDAHADAGANAANVTNVDSPGPAAALASATASASSGPACDYGENSAEAAAILDEIATRAKIAATVYKIIMRRIPHSDRQALYGATKSAARIIEYKLHQIAPTFGVYSDLATLERRVVAMASLVRRKLLELRAARAFRASAAAAAAASSSSSYLEEAQAAERLASCKALTLEQTVDADAAASTKGGENRSCDISARWSGSAIADAATGATGGMATDMDVGTQEGESDAEAKSARRDAQSTRTNPSSAASSTTATTTLTTTTTTMQTTTMAAAAAKTWGKSGMIINPCYSISKPLSYECALKAGMNCSDFLPRGRMHPHHEMMMLRNATARMRVTYDTYGDGGKIGEIRGEGDEVGGDGKATERGAATMLTLSRMFIHEDDDDGNDFLALSSAEEEEEEGGIKNGDKEDCDNGGGRPSNVGCGRGDLVSVGGWSQTRRVDEGGRACRDTMATAAAKTMKMTTTATATTTTTTMFGRTRPAFWKPSSNGSSSISRRRRSMSFNSDISQLDADDVANQILDKNFWEEVDDHGDGFGRAGRTVDGSGGGRTRGGVEVTSEESVIVQESTNDNKYDDDDYDEDFGGGVGLDAAV